MGRKHKHPEHENLERWLVSYADFITLLFATFTALFAIASADLAKMKDVSKAISDGFNQESIISGIKSVLQGQSPPSEKPNPLSDNKGAADGVLDKYQSLTYTKGEIQDVEKSVQNMKSDIEDINEEIRSENRLKPPDIGQDGQQETRGVQLSVQSRGIKVSFDSSLLFEPGSATLRPRALKALSMIAQRLKAFSGSNLIQVEGHTDNQPIATAVFPSNWELSTARASAVVRFFAYRQGYDPAYLSATGFADARPVADNKTPAGRAKNRRIDIIVYSKMVANQTDPKQQGRWEKRLAPAAASATPTLAPLAQKREDAVQTGPVKVIFVDTHASGGPKETIITPKAAAPKETAPPSSLHIQPTLEKGARITPVRVAAPIEPVEKPPPSH
ncbi:MAG: OmpA family protein [Vampirovibrionales bacterium]|nr:OmpA family protein [Vampirovibrionales bacterium]